MQPFQRHTLFVAVALAAVAASACSYSPRNKQRLNRAGDPVVWAGGTNTPNESVMLVHADAQGFSTSSFVAGTKTSTDAYRDVIGTDWFGWSQDVTIPSHFWKKTGANEMQARLKTVTMKDSTGAFNPPLVTFDIGAATDNCLKANESQGLRVATLNCRSPQSGIVTVTAPCGTLGDACCENSCNAGLTCYTQGFKCVKPAGAQCSADSECSPLNRCIGGLCAQPATIKIGNVTKQMHNSYKTFSFPKTEVPANSTLQFSPREAPNQSVTVFDWPYGLSSTDNGGSAMVGDLNAGKWACLPMKFTTLNVPPNQTLSTTVPHRTSFMVRYNHGTCSRRVPWKQTFFEPFSAAFFESADALLKAGLKDGLKPFTNISRDYDIGQVQFRSNGETHEWGFFYQGAYDVTAFGTRTRLEVSPGFAFEPSAVDGFVSVRSLNQGVFLLPDLQAIRPSITEALRTDVPKIMQRLIREQMEVPVATVAAALGNANPGDQSCSASASITSQQNTCLPKARAALGAFGSALTPRHLSCNPSNQCALHPPVQAVNVLPEALELVFAPDPAGGADPLTPLYRQVPGLCETPQPAGPKTGVIATLHHGDNAFATPCGPIL